MTAFEYLESDRDLEIVETYCETQNYCLNCKFCADDMSCMLLKEDLTIEDVKEYAEIAKFEMGAK